jgi:MoxR-like ATPase
MSDFEMADTNPTPPNAGTPTTSSSGTALTAPMNDAATAETFEKIFFELRKVIVGQSRLLERLLVGVLCRGHCLLESVPGLAKTLAAETLAGVVGGSFARIQFTPDLLPSDIVGTRIYRAGSETFDVELGPVFVNFLLTDEINRAPAKVQSALLEVMAEQQVTIGGITHPVEPPFFVVATQNPIESEGVYRRRSSHSTSSLVCSNVLTKSSSTVRSRSTPSTSFSARATPTVSTSLISAR